MKRIHFWGGKKKMRDTQLVEEGIIWWKLRMESCIYLQLSMEIHNKKKQNEEKFKSQGCLLAIVEPHEADIWSCGALKWETGVKMELGGEWRWLRLCYLLLIRVCLFSFHFFNCPVHWPIHMGLIKIRSNLTNPRIRPESQCNLINNKNRTTDPPSRF